MIASTVFEHARTGDAGGEDVKATVSAKLWTNDLRSAQRVIYSLDWTATKEAEVSQVQ